MSRDGDDWMSDGTEFQSSNWTCVSTNGCEPQWWNKQLMCWWRATSAMTGHVGDANKQDHSGMEAWNHPAQKYHDGHGSDDELYSPCLVSHKNGLFSYNLINVKSPIHEATMFTKLWLLCVCVTSIFMSSTHFPTNRPALHWFSA